MSLRKEGNKKMAKLLLEDKSNNSVSKVPIIHPYTENEALALIINCRLSVDQYQTLRIGAKYRGANIYPSYHKLLDAKALCYPENIIITEKSAEVRLKSLLDHTVSRLANVYRPVLDSINPLLLQRTELLLKWRFEVQDNHNINKNFLKTLSFRTTICLRRGLFLYSYKLYPMMVNYLYYGETINLPPNDYADRYVYNL
ncbi:hypothetical protein ALC57_05136 [Trachymyrmex cornetzi]|uniref:Uncharacterized protein n=1 Tax=Trachymyrmex cornetzi TaxID=471704 RepID=A0A151JBH3_9HYME|nr:hypothetical protein ALC57_05136 [Trachymyrmex cornetzi]